MNVEVHELVGIAITGAIGALVRHHFGAYAHLAANRIARHDTPFPYGTLAVNVAGSFVLGLVTALASSGSVTLVAASILGNGFCGAVTTFSTVAVDLERMLAAKRLVRAAIDLALTLAGCLAAAWVGLSIVP